MASKKILIVDDEPSICTVLSDLLEDKSTEITTANDGKTAFEKALDRYDVALVDLSLPGASGLEILRKIKDNHPTTPVIIMTAYASIQTAIQALRQGAYDFITKPFDLDEVQLLVERALERTRLIDENRYLLGELKSRYNFDNVIGHSREVQEAYLMAARVADSNASVLILGETGTGKEF
jgi:DNA-binding NtrC family response regulator